MNYKSKTIALILLFVAKLSVSQTAFTPKVVPPSPNAATFVKYGDTPVTYYNGLASKPISIYKISEKGINVDINLSYHMSGIKVAEEAGTAGLGWALNFGGIVSKTTIGEDDFENSRYFTTSTTNNIPTNPSYKPNVDFVQIGTDVPGNQTVHKVKFLNGSTPVDLTLISEDAYANEYEPDLYNFNFGGYSGKFVITRDKQIILLRKEKIKIRMIEGSGPSTNPGAYISFEITTPDGTVYTFAQQEVYANASGSTTPHVSSWYLTKINSAEGHQINFTYTVSSNVATYSQGAISETKIATRLGYDCNNTDPQTGLNNQDAAPQRSPIKNVSVVHIDKIDFLNGFVKFNYGGRTDLLYDKKIETIEIFKKTATSQTRLKYFQFGYDYFNGSLDADVGGTSDGSISQRLKLLTLTEKTDAGTALPAHTFTYYEGDNNTTLPAKTSFAIDHWGYFNGNLSNTSLIPTFTILPDLDELRYYYGKMTGTQRNAFPNFSKAFSLKKVEYPTGGFSEFEYENNDFDVANSEINDYSFDGQTSSLVEVTRGSIYYNTNFKGQPQDSTFNASNAYVADGQTASPVEVNVYCRFPTSINCNNAQTSGKVYFELINQETLADFGHYDMLTMTDCSINNNTNSCTNRYCTNDNLMMGIRFNTTMMLPPGNYIWRAYAQDVTGDFVVQDFVATFKWYELSQVQNNNNGLEIAGSQRIKKITDNDGTNNIIRNFNYHYLIPDPDNSNATIEKSAGRRMTRPQYSFWYKKSCYQNTTTGLFPEEGVFLYRTSNSMIPLNGSASGSIVGYDRVEVTYGANGENGKSIFYYNNEADRINFYGYYRTPTIASEPFQNNGDLLKQEDYRYDGLNAQNKPIYTKIKESINDYSINETPAIVWGSEIRNWEFLGGNAPFQIKKHFFLYPSLKSYYYYTKTNTEKLFNTADLSKYTETKTDYFYENPNHLQLTKKELVTSSGEKRKFVYQYPLDLASGTNVYQGMVDAFIHSPVVTQNEYLETSLANTQNTVYKKWYNSRMNIPFGNTTIDLPALFAPEKIEIKVGSGALRTAIDFLSYDDYGNLTQYRELNGLANTLSYYTNHASNADAGKYNLVKTSTNDLSHISSFDFEPLVGLTLATDINGNKAMYEYDGFKRLETVKETKVVSPGVTTDLILKYLRYHYQSQTTPTSLGASPSTAQNYVASLTPRTEQETIDTNEEQTTTSLSFVDKLGKPTQSITWKGVPDKSLDIINSSTIYDAFGREKKSILPTQSNVATGDFVSTAETLANSFHGDANAYIENIYENSPLNRISQQFNSGADLRTAPASPKTFFNESAGTDIPRYTLSGNNVIKGTLTYTANSLYKTGSIDEVGNETVEIKDNEGKLIQKQTKIGTNNYLTTHYIYNELNQLKAIIQPEAYPLMADIAYTADHLFFNNYDDKGRVIVKKIPAAGLEYLVYDRWDRLVLSQSAMQRTSNKWTFFKYDALNRIIISGEKVFSGKTHDNLQADAMADPDHHEVYNGTGITNYTLGTSYPTIDTGTDAVYQINYYDSYDDNTWTSGLDFDDTETSHKQALAKGMLTGTKVFNQVTGNSWLRTANYYDYKNRLIQTHKEQHLATQPDVCSYEYNFAGETLLKKHKHKKPGDVLLKEIHSNTLDHLGRILINNHSIDDKPTNMANYGYDNISRLKTKLINSQNGGETKANGDWSSPSVWLNGQLPASNSWVKIKHSINIPANYKAYGATIEEYSGAGITMGLDSYLYLNPTASPNPLQKIDFDYHVRGGILGINLNGGAVSTALDNDLFSYKLDYKKDNNILSQNWKNSVANQERSWTYAYDGASRLSSATYAPGGSYTLSGITYDKNGNIKTLARNGIDNLEYDYTGTGNRLNYVKDLANNDAGFKDNAGGGNGQDYTYWEDGSLKSDRNKGIYQIDYDTYLKKVKQISFNSTLTEFVKFYYSGDGNLIRRESSIANNKWDYTDGLIYKNEVPYQMNTAEGRAVFNGTDWEYEFEYRDHLGNLRSSFKNGGSGATEVQTSENDAFGFVIPALSVTNSTASKYLFQKQERIDDFGLNIDWFKYRPFDPAIGKGWQVDGLSSDYTHNSPYAFSENKVTGHIELDGLEAVPSLQGQLYKGAGFNYTPNAKETQDLGVKLLKMWGQAMATVALMAAPVEELLLGGAGLVAKEVGLGLKVETSFLKEAKISNSFERVMSKAELESTQSTDLLRGGREGENFFSGEGQISKDAKRTQQRLGLDGKLREYKVSFEISDPKVNVSGPRTAKPGETGTAGGGTEYSTSEKTPIKINKIEKLKNTGQ